MNVVCQDDLGSAENCKTFIEKALKHGENVIIDRVNLHPKDRQMWKTYCKSVKADCRLVLLW